MDSEPETGDGLGGAFAGFCKACRFRRRRMYRGAGFQSRRRTPRLALRELGSRPNQQDGIRRIGAVDFLHAG